MRKYIFIYQFLLNWLKDQKYILKEANRFYLNQQQNLRLEHKQDSSVIKTVTYKKILPYQHLINVTCSKEKVEFNVNGKPVYFGKNQEKVAGDMKDGESIYEEQNEGDTFNPSDPKYVITLLAINQKGESIFQRSYKDKEKDYQSVIIDIKALEDNTIIAMAARDSPDVLIVHGFKAMLQELGSELIDEMEYENN